MVACPLCVLLTLHLELLLTSLFLLQHLDFLLLPLLFASTLLGLHAGAQPRVVILCSLKTNTP